MLYKNLNMFSIEIQYIVNVSAEISLGIKVNDFKIILIHCSGKMVTCFVLLQLLR